MKAGWTDISDMVLTSKEMLRHSVSPTDLHDKGDVSTSRLIPHPTAHFSVDSVFLLAFPERSNKLLLKKDLICSLLKGKTFQCSTSCERHQSHL